ncbi:MAG: MoaD/ThiS family protein [Pyrinomonadaceae bacterium]|nr:MoaD/ThiS family protein [Pyrinomonadaceae bacterium]
MPAHVLFFGATAEMAGKRKIEIEPAPDMTAGSLVERLVSDYPALASHKLRISVNQTYADAAEPVSDGDEVAVFTAVSGG